MRDVLARRTLRLEYTLSVKGTFNLIIINIFFHTLDKGQNNHFHLNQNNNSMLLTFSFVDIFVY